MNKYMLLLLVMPLFIRAGGESHDIKSSQLKNTKYEKQKDVKPAKKSAAKEAEKPAEQKKSNRILSLFSCCCGRVEKN
jgi:hypothetical protein